MTFKKDYINYLLYSVVNSPDNGLRDNYRLSKLVDTIISVDDVMKVTYLVGKTAGLETLFKYLLYISDKIDKAQVTVFNLKDNFDYDVRNLARICGKISEYKSETVQEAIENITEEMSTQAAEEEMPVPDDESAEGDENSAVEQADNTGLTIEDDSGTSEDEPAEGGLTLIENTESFSGGTEVFELESISDSVDNSGSEETQPEGESSLTGDEDEKSWEDEKTGEDDKTVEEETGGEEHGKDKITEETGIGSREKDITGAEDEPDTEEQKQAEVFELESAGQNQTGETDEDEQQEEKDEQELLPELEIEVHKPQGISHEEEHIKEETITNEAYYKFETKFFEEVKILEKLFASTDKDCRTVEGKLSERCLQCLTEIIEITSELSSLSRQLSFDLIADIFLTMNLYYTKAISQPDILTGERVKILDSSLALVNSLIKGEDYLNYDTVVDKIEKLKADISGEKEEKYTQEELAPEPQETAYPEGEQPAPVYEEVSLQPQKNTVKQSQMDSAVFKLKYLVKEFEKSFASIGNLKGEYSKFDALEKISELNNALRLIAKIAAIVKLNDVLKLAEVTYVFLKYVKDYRMDLMEPEIQQIIKYIIFTFKMLLTGRKPEDFNVLVQHLNNPVKIFADS